MNTTELTPAAQVPETRSIDMKLEVVILPVSDAERTKRFFASLGWREDADFVFSEDFRVLQFTTPGSEASLIFGTGVTTAVPGSVGSLLLAVDDVEAARAELIERGVEVSEIFHGVAFTADGSRREPGLDPERKTYGSYASFSDPDGNTWMLQEIRTRLPGRVTSATYESPAELAEALTRAKDAHGKHEERTGEADPEWPAWYARYMVAEQTGEALPS